jgi:hypothetical protein
MQAAWLEKPTRAGLHGYESFQWSIDYWAHPHINNYLSADWEFTATGGTAYLVRACSVGGFVCAVLKPTSTTTADVVSWSGNNGWLAIADFDLLHTDCSKNDFSENGGEKKASIAGDKFDLRIVGRLSYSGSYSPRACLVAHPGTGALVPQSDEAAFQRFYQP